MGFDKRGDKLTKEKDMGLDQYAGFRDSNGEVHDTFYWRKHARLQVFFDQMFTEQNKGDTHKLPDGDGGFGDLSHLGFNGGMGGVKITEEIVNKLDKEYLEGYPRSPRKHSGKEQQQEFTKLVEQMAKSMERVFGDKIQLEVEPKIPIKINKNKLN